MKKIAIYGYGNIGNGVAQVIDKNGEIIAKRLGEPVEVKYVLDIRDFPGDFMESKVVHDVDTIVKDPEIEVVCETMGGVEPAYTFTRKALEAGKSVCTSNKELVAARGPELLQIAKDHNCSYLFEASVGGGIPIIRPMNSSLVPEEIRSITGILNGTTNFMLTRMAKDGADYDQVLAKAQELGYAERNPEADVEGKDAARKIAILASLMAGKTYPYEKVMTKGITKVTARDFAYAKAIGMQIRLLATARMNEQGEIAAFVEPCMLPEEHPLARVEDVMNAVYVQGNLLGDTMYYGAGAGKLPTASAVVSDVVEALRAKGRTIPVIWENTEAATADPAELPAAFFLRVPRVSYRDLRRALRNMDLVEIPGVLTEEVGILTDTVSQNELRNKVKDVIFKSVLRVEGLKKQ